MIPCSLDLTVKLLYLPNVFIHWFVIYHVDWNWTRLHKCWCSLFPSICASLLAPPFTSLNLHITVCLERTCLLVLWVVLLWAKEEGRILSVFSDYVSGRYYISGVHTSQMFLFLKLDVACSSVSLLHMKVVFLITSVSILLSLSSVKDSTFIVIHCSCS